MRIARALALAGCALAIVAGCTPWYDREYCTQRTVEEARAQVLKSLGQTENIEILECFVIPKTESVHGCVLRIDAKDFATLFPHFEFSAEAPPPDPKKSYSTKVAARHDFVITGVVTAVWESRSSNYYESLRLLHNQSRDRVIALFSERDCHTPAEVIN